jgi:hypothetical protein
MGTTRGLLHNIGDIPPHRAESSPIESARWMCRLDQFS